MRCAIFSGGDSNDNCRADAQIVQISYLEGSPNFWPFPYQQHSSFPAKHIRLLYGNTDEHHMASQQILYTQKQPCFSFENLTQSIGQALESWR